MKLEVSAFGLKFSRGAARGLFGFSDLKSSQLKDLYPNIIFKFLTQVHGIQYHQWGSLSSVDVRPQADGHYTKNKNLGLCILTADCMPIFIAGKNHIFAIHAGWRGLANGIITEGLKKFAKLESSLENLQCWVGPHIQGSSFEVDRSLARDFDSLHARYLGMISHEKKSTLPSTVIVKKNSDKAHVSLSALAMSELISFGVDPGQLLVSDMDTLQDPRLHSYRRNSQDKGRNISFIYLS